MSKGYEAYMPKKKETKLVQGSVDEELYDKVRDVLDVEGWSWPEFLTGLFQKFLDDRSKKRVG